MEDLTTVKHLTKSKKNVSWEQSFSAWGRNYGKWDFSWWQQRKDYYDKNKARSMAELIFPIPVEVVFASSSLMWVLLRQASQLESAEFSYMCRIKKRMV